MPKREKRLTKRERKEQFGKGPSGTPNNAGSKHIHCIACGRHVDPTELTKKPPSATWLTCQHGSTFAACVSCKGEAQARLDEHDRTGAAPQIAAAWH
jgi:hypothetical protein